MSEETTSERPNGKVRHNRPQAMPSWWNEGESRRSIQKKLGLHRNVVDRITRESGIQGFLSSDGLVVRYPPGTAEKLLPLVTPEDQADSDMAGKTPEPLGSELLGGGTALLKQAHNHIEKIFALVTQPMARALDALEKSNERLTARCETLEKDRDKVAAEREQLLNEASYRSMAEKQVEGEEQRKADAWTMLKNGAPVLFDQIKKTIIGKDPKVQEQIVATIDLLSSIKPDELQALREIGFLDEKRASLVDTILKHRPADPKKEEPAKAESKGKE